MMVTGDQGLTQDEQIAHFALWCVMSAPLMLGDDPRIMTPDEETIVLNRDAIAINQDPTEQGRRLLKNGDAEVWVKKMTGDRLAVLLLNRNADQTQSFTVKWKDFGVSGVMQVKDVYGRADLGQVSRGISLPCPPHGCRLLLLTRPH